MSVDESWSNVEQELSRPGFSEARITEPLQVLVSWMETSLS